MADVTTAADSGTQNSEDLIIDIVSLTESGSSFTIGGSLLSSTITADDCVRLGRSSNENPTDSYWYTYNASINVTEDSYYAIMFTSNNTNGTAKIYFTDDYRSDLFPQVMASTSGLTPNWSNSNFEAGITLYGGGKQGCLCSGFLGNTVEDGGDSFASGEVNIGGTDAKRGYQTYLYSLKTDNDVSIKFSQSSPDSASDGSTEETNRSSMSWFWFQEGTLPISNNPEILNDTSSVARLEGATSFVLFTQPEKYSPYPKLYFPETSLDLKNKKIDTHVYHQGWTDRPVEGKVVGTNDPSTTGVIENVSNDFSHDNWAHFF